MGGGSVEKLLCQTASVLCFFSFFTCSEKLDVFIAYLINAGGPRVKFNTQILCLLSCVTEVASKADELRSELMVSGKLWAQSDV